MHSKKPDSHLIFLVQTLRETGFGLLWSIALATTSSFLDLLPYIVGSMLIEALVSGTAQADNFIFAAAVLIVSIPLSFFAFGSATKLSHTIAFQMIRRIRAQLFQSCQNMSLGRLSRMSSGEMRKLLLDEPERLELLVAHGIPEITSAALSWLVVTVWLFFLDWRMAAVTLVLSPLAFICLAMALKSSARGMAEFHALAKRQSTHIGEAISGIEVLKSNSGITAPEWNTRQSFQALSSFKNRLGQGFAPMGAVYFVLMSANLSFLVPVGLLLLSQNAISVEIFLICLILGGNYTLPLARLFGVFREFAHIAGSISIVQEAIDTPAQLNTGHRLVLEDHNITVENASLTLGGKDILKDVSCRFKSGQFTAIVGPSGAGKSSLCEAIMRFCDLTHGRISIGGQDISAMDLGQLIETVSFVFQDTFLFHGTVAENLRVAKPDAIDAELTQAARAACADGFIRALPQGYDTVIGSGRPGASGQKQHGHGLSGGQAQRLAIARAILKDSPILILDEATASVDPENETLVQRAISRLIQGRTLIVIAHRLHRITQADQVIVMDQGRIVQIGQHEFLRRQSGLYRDLWTATCTQGVSSSSSEPQQVPGSASATGGRS
ncbi:ABC transporter ATP-binding protein [Pseudophaeobacter sp.]|uniref:ABC transporter ATP-binding protein n=1 Tax=Pseudophaeobacter sp. TaxID=1971739 RepID=UPI00405889C2